MASVIVVTEYDARLDQVCAAHYGAAPGYVEATLDANPGLADMGLVLPAGTQIEMPDNSTVTPAAELVRLWT